MSSALSAEQIMRLIAQAVPDMARRAVAQPTFRLGFVDQDQDPDDDYALVIADGDEDAVPVMNMTGVLLMGGNRVMLTYYPPHGVIVSGVMVSQEVRPWATAWGHVPGGEASSTGLAFNTTTQIQVTLTDVPVLDGRRYEVRASWRARCAADQTVIALTLQYDTGTGWTDLRIVPVTFALGSTINTTEAAQWTEYFDATADGSVNVRFLGHRVSSAAAQTTPNLAHIEVIDVGPTPT